MPVKIPVKTPVCSWKANSHVRVDPDMAYLEFMAVRASNNGRLTPSGVIERAQVDGSILHDEFEWDKDVASRLHWEQQASHLIRSMVVVYKRDGKAPEIPTVTRAVPAFIRLRPHADTPALTEFEQRVTEKGNYTPVAEIMADTGARRLLLHQAWRDFAALRQKYRDLGEFAEIFDAIDRMKGKIA